jgi:hypothetical protein
MEHEFAESWPIADFVDFSKGSADLDSRANGSWSRRK